MSKINIDQTFKTFEGKNVQNMGEGGKQVDFTLKSCIIQSLLNQTQDDRPTGAEKLTRYDLALRAQKTKGGFIELTSEEITLIKKLVDRAFNTLIYAQAVKMLEGKDPLD